MKKPLLLFYIFSLVFLAFTFILIFSQLYNISFLKVNSISWLVYLFLSAFLSLLFYIIGYIGNFFNNNKVRTKDQSFLKKIITPASPILMFIAITLFFIGNGQYQVLSFYFSFLFSLMGIIAGVIILFPERN